MRGKEDLGLDEGTLEDTIEVVYDEYVEETYEPKGGYSIRSGVRHHVRMKPEHSHLLSRLFLLEKVVAKDPPRARYSRAHGPGHFLPSTGPSTQTNRDWDSNDEIDRLYGELTLLNSQQAEDPENSEVRNKIRECFVQLRKLQEEEATAIEMHFSSTLSLPIGRAEQLLRHAEEMTRNYANTSKADSTSDGSDDSATQP